MKKINSTLPFLLCIIFLVIVNTGIAQEEQESKEAQARSVGVNKNDYTIGVGDILEISTWKEPELTRRQIIVRTDGNITFPLLNDVQAAGKTPMELKKEIESGLSNYISSPVVTVDVTDAVSQKIYILGEVQDTGEYPLTKNLTVLQAFAVAGGFTQWASKKEIILLRKESGKEKIYKINYKNITKGKDLEQNMQLQAGDTIIVP